MAEVLSRPASSIEDEYRKLGESTEDFDNAFKIAEELGYGDLVKEFGDLVKEIAKKRGQAWQNGQKNISEKQRRKAFLPYLHSLKNLARFQTWDKFQEEMAPDTIY